MNYRLSLTFTADDHQHASWIVSRIEALLNRKGVRISGAKFEQVEERFEPVVATGAPDLEAEALPTGTGYRS